jgi:hypothetical protein
LEAEGSLMWAERAPYDGATVSAATRSRWSEPRDEERSASALLEPMNPEHEARQKVTFARFVSARRGPLPLSEPPEWSAFLRGLTDSKVGLDAVHARRVRQVWNELRGAVGAKLPLPRVERVEDDALCLSWSSEALYAEIAIRADGSHTWFVRDHRSDQHDGSTDASPGSPSRSFLQFLQSAFNEPR